jgi:hypothetical protein
VHSGRDLTPSETLDADAIPVWRDGGPSNTALTGRARRAQERRRGQKWPGLARETPPTSSADAQGVVARWPRLRGAFDRPALAGRGPSDELRGLVRVST